MTFSLCFRPPVIKEQWAGPQPKRQTEETIEQRTLRCKSLCRLNNYPNCWVSSCEFICDVMAGAVVIVFVAFLLFGLEIPSFFILESRLVLGNPSRAAAPSGPPTIQPVSSNVRKITDRMESLNVCDVQFSVAVFCGHV